MRENVIINVILKFVRLTLYINIFFMIFFADSNGNQ